MTIVKYHRPATRPTAVVRPSAALEDGVERLVDGFVGLGRGARRAALHVGALGPVLVDVAANSSERRGDLAAAASLRLEAALADARLEYGRAALAIDWRHEQACTRLALRALLMTPSEARHAVLEELDRANPNRWLVPRTQVQAAERAAAILRTLALRGVSVADIAAAP